MGRRVGKDPQSWATAKCLKHDLPLVTVVFLQWFQLCFPQWLVCITGVGPNPNPPFTHPKSGDGSSAAVRNPAPAASPEGLCRPTRGCKEEISEQALKLVLNAKLRKLLFSSLCCNSATAFKSVKVKCCYSAALRVLLTNVICHRTCDDGFYDLPINSFQTTEIHL